MHKKNNAAESVEIAKLAEENPLPDFSSIQPIDTTSSIAASGSDDSNNLDTPDSADLITPRPIDYTNPITPRPIDYTDPITPRPIDYTDEPVSNIPSTSSSNNNNNNNEN
jgi:hypothetical protein